MRHRIRRLVSEFQSNCNIRVSDSGIFRIATESFLEDSIKRPNVCKKYKVEEK
uniref:Uncharacterized protein n=1 Tax=Onchocerca volvulus TaxID=6282 RepID=A0A8R1XRS2_ONCVO